MIKKLILYLFVLNFFSIISFAKSDNLNEGIEFI